MKALFIGGTGMISSACARLAAKRGWELTMLNRASKPDLVPEGVRVIKADVRGSLPDDLLDGEHFDTAVDFIAFTKEDIERDIRLLSGKTDQFIFISSASAYQKPIASLPITESTPLINPYWAYSRAKIECEDRLMRAAREEGFPVTIVRPSQTYSGEKIPLALKGRGGAWQTILRLRQGKRVIIPGDGNALWTSTHADDFAQGFVGLMGNPRALGTAVHITSDEALTWDQIYSVLAATQNVPLHSVHISSDFISACGRRVGYDFEGSQQGDKAANVMFDNSKIRSLVPDFKPRVSMAQGIRQGVHYLETHPECQIPDAEFDAFCDRLLAAYDNALSAF